MKEILPNMFDNIRNEMIILVIIFVAAIVIWFIGNQIDIVNGVYEAIRETINNEDHPNPNDLQELTTFRRFRKTQPEFQQAVHEKLKAYDNMFDTKVFRIVATLPQNVNLEKLDEFRKNGFTVQFIFPKLDAEEILDNDDGLMAKMITVDYDPTE